MIGVGTSRRFAAMERFIGYPGQSALAVRLIGAFTRSRGSGHQAWVTGARFAMGEAAETAAGIALRTNATPRKVDPVKVQDALRA